METLEVALPEGADPDALDFDSSETDSRYFTGRMDPSVVFRDAEATARALRADKQRYCVFGKTGGPYLRSTYLRGEAQFLMDIAADAPLARRIADKVAARAERRRSAHARAVCVVAVVAVGAEGSGAGVLGQDHQQQ